jgi:predicted transposase YbfD/YdcC
MDERVVVPSLRAIVAQVPDPRARRGRRHPWTALLLLVIVGLLCGANTQQALARWGQMIGWPRLRRLGFVRRSGPSQPTLHRLLRSVEVDQLELVLGPWLQQVRAVWHHQATHWLDGIAIEGKTLRGARRLGAVDAHLVSAFCQRQGLTLGQVAVPDPTNELGAISPLLAQLALGGETVTFDALFTQTTVAQQVIQQGGAYLMMVKGNQRGLLAGIIAATAPHPQRPVRRLGQASSVQLAHGRFEERSLEATAAPPDLGWPFARQVLRLHRRFVSKRTGEVLIDETAYAVTSLEPAQASPRQLLQLWQAHWRIENQLHWVRDVVFAEDRATTRTHHAHQAFAAFRNLVIALIHLWRGSHMTAAREFYASHPSTLLRLLGL